MSKPVVFLAFANDRVDGASYLRNLPQELNGIRQALKPAIQAGLCEVVERANATVAQILDVFQDEYFRNRIAIFHYGGHANSYQLLLETASGEHAHAHSEGLVGFLSRQRGLNLVFLNGCSSQQQAEELLTAGIPSVIGTSQSINDDLATQLSIRFYKGLAQGSTLSTSWGEAVEEAKIEKGTANMRDLLWEGASEAEVSQFPWELSFRAGAEELGIWNLPEASGNPLFGLPEPVHLDLPEQPFRFLQRYTRAEAPIFFGRGQYIRDLFDRATDRHAAPIILLYGQSGVGKSSMLEAGLFPRLEQTCEVLYARRQPDKGLLGTVKDALGIGEEGGGSQAPDSQSDTSDMQRQIDQVEALAKTAVGELKAKLLDALAMMREKIEGARRSSEEPTVASGSLKEAWLAKEKAAGKPLVLLLDQVEETYTKPTKHLPKELEDALAEIHNLFSDPKTRPQGKLILAYRKEYHPEIDEALKALRLPREHIFLRKLDHAGIKEVVSGLNSTEALRRKYQLHIEDRLPTLIADDLLEDEDSPIAPILQILLTKLWLMAEKDENRAFSINRYLELKNNGILMSDFFQEQMEKLRAWNAEIEQSGLALDVLNFHTTEWGTAGTHHWDEIRQRYEHQEEKLADLIQKFKELYLLTDAGKDSGLAHDTLAPLIQQQFRKSDKPGHRASRILESKRQEYERDRNNVLNATDLKLVEEGKGGMPAWSETESALIQASREWREKQEASRRRTRRAGIGAVAVIVLLGVFAAFQWRAAVAQTELANQRAATNELRRLQLELDLEKRAKYPEIAMMLKKEYEQYPEHPLMANLIYQLMLGCEEASQPVKGDYQTLFAKDNSKAVASLSPEDGKQVTDPLYTPNPGWEVKVKVFTTVVAHNQATGATNEFSVPVPDYGTFFSLSIHPEKNLFLVTCSDGSLRLLDLTGEVVWRTPTNFNARAYPQSAVFEENGKGFIVKYSNRDLRRYSLDKEELLSKATECWGNGPI